MIEIESVHVSYFSGSTIGLNKKEIKAVENVSFVIPNGKTVGLVGESGCGKSTLGRAILGLLPIVSGRILYNQIQIDSLSKKEWIDLRKKIQVIFQDPYSSLNPRMTVQEIISEGLSVHFPHLTLEESNDKLYNILEKVNLSKDILNRFPHEFSGGQRQRIAIARALILKPEIVICDEAVSALDVSTQAQVINLLKELKKDFDLSYLFISHDLNIVKYISDLIAVMYLGQIVEFGSRDDLISNPLHPYTRALFASSFDIKDRKKDKPILKGEIPSVLHKPSGCYFHTRCPIAKEICKKIPPQRVESKNGQVTFCHFPGDT
jgi:peptide/nickel transport system ATP-binding protein